MLISIIIPVYNAQKTLPYCLDAIFKQEYPNIELLFIDDASTDDSLDIINEYTEKNRHQTNFTTKVIKHEQNRGVAAARNTGLDKATGDYIYYIDSDDIIQENALKILVKEAVRSGSDIVGCEWLLSYKKNARHMRQPDVYSPKDAFKKMTGGVLRWNLWLFFVKRSLYENNQIRFIEGLNMGEDMMVMGKLFLCAQKVSIVHKPLYQYIQTNEDSLTKDISDKHAMQVTANVQELERYVLQYRGENYLRQIHFLKLNIKLPLLLSDNDMLHTRWKNWFPESNKYIMQNKLLPLRTRMVQQFAAKRQFWLVKLYYKLVFKFVYGVIYK